MHLPAIDAQPARHPPVRDIRDLLTFRLAAISTACDRLGQRWLSEDHDLRIAEWRALGVTAAMAPARFQDLARTLLMDKGRLSRVVRALAARRLVVTEPDCDDQRTVIVRLTEEGRALHGRILVEAHTRNEAVARGLSANEVADLFRLIDKLEPFMIKRVGSQFQNEDARAPGEHEPTGRK
ncbi:MAG: MarR family winged helix-turn-helix transcriptional regulator [Pseudomonadota bacterium]